MCVKNSDLPNWWEERATLSCLWHFPLCCALLPPAPHPARPAPVTAVHDLFLGEIKLESALDSPYLSLQSQKRLSVKEFDYIPQKHHIITVSMLFVEVNKRQALHKHHL